MTAGTPNALTKIITNGEFLPEVLGLQLPDVTTIEDWARIGDRVRLVGRSMGWIVGDWLNFGEDHFGEDYAQYAENCGYDPGVLSTYQTVAKRFAPEQRHPDVSFSHYRLLVRFTDAKVAKWIDKILDGKLSVSQLRDLIAEKEAAGEEEEAERGRPRVTKITAKWDKRIPKTDRERIETYLTREGAEVKISV